ncbi:hypothetical protein TWF696_005044 [Orbilia brochopaga]|uniref:Uncharacterized protein n=1 Tax=Orbilia brochopaga TaxID=3140254 RepID=A0AAV9V3G7_9PEZI
MSVAYPNQNPAAPNGDSFAASAAFSFEQQPTQLFGMNTSPPAQMPIQQQNPMPSSLHSVPMIQVSQVDNSGDCDMGNAQRDEDFDVDLDIEDYDEDGDINLDLATPMATAEDDLMEEAGPSSHHAAAQNTLFGQPGPSGQFANMGGQALTAEPVKDEDMADDTLEQNVNEVMLDADQPEPSQSLAYQPLLQQPQQPLQPSLGQMVNPLPQPPQPPQPPAALPADQQLPLLAATAEVPSTVDSQENTTVSPTRPPFEGYAQPVAEQLGESSLQASVHEAVQQELAAPHIQEEAEPQMAAPAPTTEAAVETTEELTELPPVPQPPSPAAETPETPRNPKIEPLKHQTPPSSLDAVRISQADTVALENPTPEVNQREWFLTENAEGHAPAAASPTPPPYQGNQEIPTSPLQDVSGDSPQPSVHPEHDAQSPRSSPPSDQPTPQAASPQQHEEHEEHSPHHEGAETGEEHHGATDEDALLNHPVVVVYRGAEFSLFPVFSESAKVPETCFLPDRTLIGSPLSKLVASLRDVLGEEFTATEEIILNFTSLGVEFEEENAQMHNFTLYDLIGLFAKLVVQDGVNEIQPLHISLTSRKKYIPKLEMIHHHILKGGGLASWKQTLGDSAQNQTVASDHSQEKHSASHDSQHEESEQEDHTINSPKAAEDEHHDTEPNDEELELQESEKDYSGDDAHDHPEIYEEEPHLDTDALVGIDVPKSPSQTSFVKPALPQGGENSLSEGSLKVSETQYSQDGQPQTPTNETNIASSKVITDDNNVSRDDASFVTAQEKQQDTSIARSHTGSRSYGLPDGLSSNEESELEQDEVDKDDGLLDFGQDHEATIESADTHHEEEDAKSSSTLQEGEKEAENDAALQDDEDTEVVVQHAWNEWTYVEDHSEHEQEEYQHPEDNGEEVYKEHHGYGLVSSTEEPTEVVDGEFDINEFANYPQPFSPFEGQDELEDEGPLLGLEQHETHSVTPSTKRAREDDEEEEEEASAGEEPQSSPVPASKRHKQT